MIGKRRATTLLLLILCVSILFNIPRVMVVKAESTTIVVPDEYPTIQEAIDVAINGDTIFVRKGTYNETIEIDSSISLIGENRETTTITGFKLDYGQPPPIIDIKAPNVTVSGFTVTGSGSTGIKAEIRGYTGYGGCNVTGNNIIDNGLAIWVYGVSNCIISDNNINENGDGIRFTGADSTISRNEIFGKGTGEGIGIDASHNVTVSENQISGTEEGIELYYIYPNGSLYVYENIITNNNYGIKLWYDCNNSIIFRNNITNNGVGIYLDDVRNPDFVGMYNQVYNNNIVDNNQQVLVDLLSDIVSWDNGKEGNYWGDYDGMDADGDGIGDTPYFIDENNQDNYPLMESIEIRGTTVIPEFPSWTPLLVLLLSVTTLTIICKRRIQNKGRR